MKQWFTSRKIGELHRYLHTDDKQFCRTHTSREWLERQTSLRHCMFFALKTWMPGIAKHGEYSSFSKRKSPIAPEYIYSALRSTKAGEVKCATKNVSCSKIVNAPKHKTQWIFFVLKAWEPTSALYTLLIRTVNRERNTRRTVRALRIRSEKGMPQRAKHDEYSSFSKRESPLALYLYIYTVLFGVLKQKNLRGLLRM